MGAQTISTVTERVHVVNRHKPTNDGDNYTSGCDQSDDNIMANAQRDPAAFGEIFERHYDDIFRYARRSLPRDIAEDCASETFVIALKKRGSYKPGRGTARPWLFGICVRLIADAQRRSARSSAGERRLHVVEDLNIPDHADAVDNETDAQAAFDRLKPALDSLRSGDRQVLELYAWADMTYGDIAQVLKVPVGTVRSRLNRARTKLQQLAQNSAATQPREAN